MGFAISCLLANLLFTPPDPSHHPFPTPPTHPNTHDLQTVLTKLAHLDLHMERCPPLLGALQQLTYLRCWGCFLDAVGAAHEPLEALADLPALRHLALMGGL